MTSPRHGSFERKRNAVSDLIPKPSEDERKWPIRIAVRVRRREASPCGGMADGVAVISSSKKVGATPGGKRGLMASVGSSVAATSLIPARQKIESPSPGGDARGDVI